MRERAAAALLALTIFLAPALGATTDELLQDTLKSAVVSFGALLSAIALLWNRREPVRWHPALLLPVLLMAYALASMAWSHHYLAAVEAVRWFIFAVLMFVATNVGEHEAVEWGIVAGGGIASLWAALQFLAGFDLFPQGASPGSTFVNRNFFAEFAVCTAPFAIALLARTQRPGVVAFLLGLDIAALFMAGTRSALVALAIVLIAIAGVVRWQRWLAVAAIAAGLSIIPGTGGVAAWEHGAGRVASIAPGDSSLAIRLDMWRATARMIEAHPLAGVGAGAWENEIPLYQPAAAPVETDYYAHNEFLQLVAECGLVGWAFLIASVAWLARLARRDAPSVSLLALAVVSCAGFAWHLAASCALFAVCFGVIAARGACREWRVPRLAPALLAAGVFIGITVTSRAVAAERKLVGAAKLAVAGSADKSTILRWTGEGIALNRHYRKITPLIADALAKQGDWLDAIPIWESVLSSRPHVVAILTNTARGYIATRRPELAMPFIQRAQRIQPDAPSVRSAEVLLLVSLGRNAEALKKGREALAQGISDADLQQAVKVLGALDVRQ